MCVCDCEQRSLLHNVPPKGGESVKKKTVSFKLLLLCALMLSSLERLQHCVRFVMYACLEL